MPSVATEPRILSVTVRYRARDGKEGELSIDPEEHDAVFWTLDAVDRFLLPYYFANCQFDDVADVRQNIAREQSLTIIPIPRHKKICKIVLGLRREDPMEFSLPPRLT